MSLSHFFLLVRHRWPLLGACVFAMVAAALLVRLLAPANYKAVASVVVDPRGINPVSGRATQEPLAQDAVVGTYANIGRSEAVARQVVADLGTEYWPALQAHWLEQHGPALDFGAWLARRLLKQVDVRAGGQSSRVLDIAFSDPDPVRATRMANAFAAALMSNAKALRVLPAQQNAAFFETQAKALELQLEQSQTRLAQFQNDYGITSLDERVDIETARLAALSAQAVINQAQSRDSATRAQFAVGRAASPDVVNNTLIQALSAEVTKQTARVQELSVRLGANHPDFLTARSQLDEARTALASESARVASSIGTGRDIAVTRAAAASSDSDLQRHKVLRLNSVRVELSTLEREVAQRRQLYETAVQRSTETSLEALNQHDDVRLLAPALQPDARSGPGLAVTLPLAAVVGVMLGTLLTLAWERWRPRIRRVADFHALGLPVLPSVPVLRLTASRADGLLFTSA